jgi:hypothetical protein
VTHLQFILTAIPILTCAALLLRYGFTQAACCEEGCHAE